MDVYLPIANLAVNGLVIILLGGVTGVLSGIFGVGGGFLTTPLLIFYGIPPTVAAASTATTVTGASVSGLFAYSRRNGVDYQMGAVMVAGGILGTLIGSGVFKLLQSIGQIDTAINLLYVLLLGTIGSLMGRESLQALRHKDGAPRRAAKRRHHPLVSSLPLRWRSSSNIAAKPSDRVGPGSTALTVTPLPATRLARPRDSDSCAVLLTRSGSCRRECCVPIRRR